MPGPYQFGAASMKEYLTLDVRLQMVCDEVIKRWDCKILQGRRTEAEHQAQLAAGTSRTQHSKHVVPEGVPCPAMDLAPWQADGIGINWKDNKTFYAFAGVVLGVAFMLGIPLRWGGDWNSNNDLNDQTFNDLVHFELVP